MLGVHSRAAELAVDIVNARRDGELDRDWVDRLTDREPLPIRHARRSAEQQGRSLLAALRGLADDLGPVFETDDPAEAANRLNALLARLDVQVSVSIDDDWPPHLHFDAYASEVGDRLRVNCLMAIASVLADPSGAMRIGECASRTCNHVFVDFSRSARQRFCSRRCATRRHVSEHRQRVAEGA